MIKSILKKVLVEKVFNASTVFLISVQSSSNLIFLTKIKKNIFLIDMVEFSDFVGFERHNGSDVQLQSFQCSGEIILETLFMFGRPC